MTPPRSISGVRRQPQSAKARDQSAGRLGRCRTTPPVPPGIPSEAAGPADVRPVLLSSTSRASSRPVGCARSFWRRRTGTQAAMYATPSVGHRWTPTPASSSGLRSTSGGLREITRRIPVLEPSAPLFLGCSVDFKRHPPPPGLRSFLRRALAACWFNCCPAGLAKSITPGRLL